MRSPTRPMSQSFPSVIACLLGWRRLESRAYHTPASRVLIRLLVRWSSGHHHSIHSTDRKTGTARRPVHSATRSHSRNRGKRVVTRSCKRAKAAWQQRRLRRESSTVSGTLFGTCLRDRGASSGHAICPLEWRHERRPRNQRQTTG